MNKWFFVLIIMAGAIWHFTHKGQAQHDNQAMPSDMTHAPLPAKKYNQQTPIQRTLSEPTEEQCRSVGGHIISGMGCVTGSHEPTEAECTSVNGRMVSGIGCVSNEPPREPTETECTSLGGHFVKDFGCVSN